MLDTNFEIGSGLQKIPQYTDVHVGMKFQTQQKSMCFSQPSIAAALGIPFQQVQKYESGANRVGSSRLSDIAEFLGVRIDFFFDEARTGESVQKRDAADELQDFIGTTEGLALNTNFALIKDDAVRKAIVALVRAASSMA